LKAFSGSHFGGQGILLDCSRPVIANFGDAGYYRVQYEDAGLRALGASYKQLAPEDRVSLLADSWAMVQAGRADVRTYLDLTKHLTGETDLAVWTRVIDTLRQFDDLERGSPGRGAFRAFARNLMALSHCWKKNARILRLEHYQATATASRQTFIAAVRKARLGPRTPVKMRAELGKLPLEPIEQGLPGRLRGRQRRPLAGLFAPTIPS
jgi:ERAP1-like C-terminal domain